MSILTREEWQQLPTKGDRKAKLQELRREYEDKAIRDAWGLTPQQYYSLMFRFGLSKKRADNDKPKEPKPPGSGRGRGRPRKETATQQDRDPLAEEDKDDAERRDSIPSDRRWPRDKVIDADYEIISEDTRSPDQFALAVPAPAVDLPFPTIKGTPSQLRKQFEAVALFLEGHEDETTRFEIRISAVKV